MLDERIKKELAKEQPSAWHDSLLRTCNSWLDSSRQVMGDYYEQWDRSLEQYEAKAKSRRKDDYADEEERPKAQSVPMTYGQIETWRAFATSLLSQRQKQFEHEGVGPEDAKWMGISDTVLESDLRANKWKVLRGQFLKSLGIFGIGIFKHQWREWRKGLTLTLSEGGTAAFGQTFNESKRVLTTGVVFRKGNEIKLQDPYRFFPDPAVSLTEFEEGRFVASEHEMSRSELKALEAHGVVSGIDHVTKSFPSDRWIKRERYCRFKAFEQTQNPNDYVIITEVQMKIVPKFFKVGDADGDVLGESTDQVVLLLWVANDQRIIRLEVMNYLHGSYTYDLAVFDTETHTYIGQAITDRMARLSETNDWLINSRIESVARNVEPQLIADTTIVDIEALKRGDRVIPVKKGAARAGLERYVFQLRTQDPTSRHIEDVFNNNRLIDRVTGFNDNMSGSFHSGRRSATEARVVAGGAASRGTLHVDEVWTMAFEPLGGKLLKNLRQGYNEEEIKKIVGDVPPEHIARFRATPQEIATSVDIFIFDGTTPTEKRFIAQTLQEVLSLVLQPGLPEAVDLSPKLLLDKILELHGINYRNDFSLANDPQLLQQIIMQQAQMIAAQILQQQPTNGNGTLPGGTRTPLQPTS